LSFPSPKEFYEKFKRDPEAARRSAFDLGVEMGQQLKRRYGIQGESLEVIADILNAAMRTVQCSPSAKTDDEKVTMQNTGFCAVMRAALTLNLPWEWLDNNFAWPWLEGIVSAVTPGTKLRVPSARCRGDRVCTHIFEKE
jgi:hypothetical protein